MNTEQVPNSAAHAWPATSAPTHTLAYAYPSSDSAVKHGYSAAGCYTVKSSAGESPFETIVQALQYVEGLGTVPSTWSLDHPRHARALHDAHKTTGVYVNVGGIGLRANLKGLLIEVAGHEHEPLILIDWFSKKEIARVLPQGAWTSESISGELERHRELILEHSPVDAMLGEFMLGSTEF